METIDGALNKTHQIKSNTLHSNNAIQCAFDILSWQSNKNKIRVLVCTCYDSVRFK